MKEALEEEIKRSPLTYSTEEYGTLPALVVLVDMGWQKRAAGRLYNSPSGVLHVIGAYTKKLSSRSCIEIPVPNVNWSTA